MIKFSNLLKSKITLYNTLKQTVFVVLKNKVSQVLYSRFELFC